MFNFIYIFFFKIKDIYKFKKHSTDLNINFFFLYPHKTSFHKDYYFFKHHNFSKIHEKYTYGENKFNLDNFYKKIDYLKISKIKKIDNDCKYTVINPTFNWYEKIKNSKKYLNTFFDIDNKMFKKFIKNFNCIQNINYFNTIFYFLYFFFNQNINEIFYFNKVFVNGYETYDVHKNVYKNDVISFDEEKYNNNIYEFKNPQIWKNNKTIFLFQKEFLSNNFFILKENPEYFFDNSLNIINWKSYCWQTKKKFV